MDPAPGAGSPLLDPPGTTEPPPPEGRIFDRSVSDWARRLLAGNRQITADILAVLDRGDAAAVGTLIDLLRRGSSDTRTAMALILGRVGTADARVMPALSGALRDSEPSVRINTLESYRVLGDDAGAAVPETATVMVEDREWAVRHKAATTLQAMPAESLKPSLPTILRGLRDRDQRVKAETVKVLEKIADAYPDTRSNIRMAIVTSGGAEGLLDELLKRLGDR
jgi:HEAT repeat protein